MKITFPIFLFLLTKSIECKKPKPAEVKFLKVSTYGNPKYLEYCRINITPNSNERAIDIQARLLVNITKELLTSFQFFMKNKLGNEYKEIFSYDFDVCRVMEGFMSQTIARFWAQNLKKYSNIAMICPVLQKDYYVKKMKIDRKSIPMVVEDGFYLFKAQLRIPKKDQMDHLANWTVEVDVRL